MRERGVGEVAQRIDADAGTARRSRGRRTPAGCRAQSRPGVADSMIGPQTVSTSSAPRRSEPAAAGQQRRMHARHERPAIVRAAGDVARTAHRRVASAATAHAGSAVGQPRGRRSPRRRRRPRAARRAPRRCRRRRRPRGAAASSPGAHRTCSATSCSRVRRGCRTQIFAPRLAALRRRRCRIGTSCSASSPTTRITFGALDVLVGDGHRRARPRRRLRRSRDPPSRRWSRSFVPKTVRASLDSA